MSGSYPNLLAAGVTAESTFAPFELWAGESDLVTSQGTAAVDLLQFQVVERDTNGKIIPYLGHTGTGGTDSVTFTGLPSANDTVTINGVVITFVASGAAGNQVNIAGSVAAQATALAAFVNGTNEEALLNVSATSSAGVVTLTSAEPGDNSVTVAKSGTNITVGTATTAGGTHGRRALGFMAQAAVAGGPAAYYTGGVPNHLALIWPASLSTLDQRKAAFDGTNITVSSLL